MNDERGIEQGFTLEQRPDGEHGHPIVVEGAIAGLLAFPSDDGASVLLRTPHGEDALRMRDLVVKDAAGAELRACLAASTGAIQIWLDDRDAAYPITIDPLLTSPAWTKSSDQAGGTLGVSVATAGDVNGDGYSDVVVGAHEFYSGQLFEGRAFAFLGSPTGLSTTPAWTFDGNQANAYLGMSVATAGDVNGDGYSDVIVGADGYDNGQSNEGRAFLFHGSAAGLAAAPAWIGESNVVSGTFGYNVATAGDVDADGYDDVLVGTDGRGAYLYAGSASGLAAVPAWTFPSGGSVGPAGDVNGDGYADVAVGRDTVRIFYGSASGLAGAPDLVINNPQNGSFFGVHPTTAGDVNGDGFADVLVGAAYYDAGETDEGRAFLYLGSASGLSASAAWTSEGNQVGAGHGFSGATAGDVNGDGFADVVIGTMFWDGGEVDEGRAVAYFGSPTGLSATPAWSIESDQAGAYLGLSVATAGDVNGDGYSDVIVGAPYHDDGQVDEGRALVFHGSPAGLSSAAGWTKESDRASVNFGHRVASAGDVNGDGYADVIVGAHFYDNGQAGEGRAFLYLGSAAGPSSLAAWFVESDQANAHLGSSVAYAGDVNGDGYSDVIVGVRDWDGGQVDEGRALVYLGSPTGLGAAPAWSCESDQASAFLGGAVATAGDVNGDGYGDILVGAVGFDGALSNEGRVFAYLGSATGLAAAPAWSANAAQDSAAFGFSVGTAGDVNGDGYSDIIVGSPSFDNDQANEGRAFAWLGSPTGPAGAPAWIAESNDPVASYGFSVATAGDVNGDGYSDVVVGASLHDGGENDEGRAFVYLGGAAGLQAAPIWTTESNQADARYGCSVATAGDVNADGYSDVIVGAEAYDDAFSTSGRGHLYLGSASGLPLTPAWTYAPPNAFASFGNSVASAGDVNGDGYADVIVGAEFLSNPQSSEGRAYVFYGNAGDGLDRAPRQRREDDSAPIDILGVTDAADFLVVADARSPFGRDRVRLEAEVEPLGTPFDGVGMTFSPWVDTGLPGARGSVARVSVEQSPTVAGPMRWRARLRGSFPFPWTSHWLTPAANAITETDLRVNDPCLPVRCDDGDGCNGIETCDPSTGACVPGTPVTCDDGNACNGIETCAPSTGACVPGTPVTCDDGNACNGIETCDPATGGCLPGTPVTCDDGDACSGVETCDPSTGACGPGTPVTCDDGDACNGVETCDPATGACGPGTPVTCDDGDACNGVETCDPATGACGPGTPVTCDDGDACNGVETCDPATGACLPGGPVTCDDGDACNGVETCDPATGGCLAGNPVICEDGDACNGVETCDPSTGGCLPGTPVICDDGDPCNGIESCDPSTGGCLTGPVLDSDNDGHGDDCGDCAPADGGAFAIPGEASLRVTKAAGSSDALIAWLDLAPSSGSATLYDVAAEGIDSLHAARSASGPCVAIGIAPLSWRDARPLPAGGAYYLARAVNSCGPPAGVGWGTDSLAVPRPACP